MRVRRCLNTVIISISLAFAARAQPQPIDTAKSTVTLHVFKAGVFSAFAHDHVITAPVTAGTVDPAARNVEIHFHAANLRVQDSKGSTNDHDQIQQTMLGPEVLDVQHFADITFRSSAVDPAGPSSWIVHGMLTLRGKTQPLTVNVTEKAGHYVGRVVLRQTDFGIEPVRIAGGTVRIKDNVQLDFDVQVAQGRTAPTGTSSR